MNIIISFYKCKEFSKENIEIMKKNLSNKGVGACLIKTIEESNAYGNRNNALIISIEVNKKNSPAEAGTDICQIIENSLNFSFLHVLSEKYVKE